MKFITFLFASAFCCFTTYQGVSQTLAGIISADNSSGVEGVTTSDVPLSYSNLDPTIACQAVPNIDGFNYADCQCAPGSYPVTEVREGITVIIGCQTCPTGSYCPDGINKFDCPAGSFSSITGSTVCASCPAGSFSSTIGSTVCASCPAGSFSSTVGSTVCASCPAGSFSSVIGSTVCASCPAGTFSNTTGSTVCTSCPAGSFSNIIGSTACASCPAGSFSSTTGSTVCASCPAGTYSNTTGSTVCRSCNSSLSVTASASSCFVYLGYGSNCTNISATATGGSNTITYAWQPGNRTGATINVCPTTTTIYTVTATDHNGCQATSTVRVEVIDIRCGNKMDKASICHNGNTLCVSPNAVPAHLAHGDKLGTCGATPCSSNNNSLVAPNTNKPTNFTVYPNPAHNEAWVNLTSFEGQAVTLTLTDMLGKILQQTVIPQASSEPQRLDTALLINGLYFIKIQTTESQMLVHKLQIMK